jgi:SAM-dependent MidA family methyltransferase
MTSSTPLPASREGSHPLLLEEIRDRISQQGSLSFSEFMSLALYHPQWGYYSLPRDPIASSPRGDYYTAPTRHAAFGALLARQVAECLQRVGGSGREWVELGPGGGDLAASVLQELRKSFASDSELCCTLVEGNPHRRASQERLLESRGVLKGVRWMTPAQWAACEEPIRGCIVANEVLDALPVQRLRFKEGAFREIRVGWRGGLIEVLEPVSSPELLERIDRDLPSLPEGWEAEVGMEARRQIRRLARRLERGYALLLDYGFLSAPAYFALHPRGTLLAYHSHATSESYLDRVGNQDLTAHVNFTSILDAARECGLQARGPVSQARLLLALGALDQLQGSEEDPTFEAYRERRTILDLFRPGGMGETHQALVLATPGCELDLRGLRPLERWESPGIDQS